MAWSCKQEQPTRRGRCHQQPRFSSPIALRSHLHLDATRKAASFPCQCIAPTEEGFNVAVVSCIVRTTAERGDTVQVEKPIFHERGGVLIGKIDELNKTVYGVEIFSQNICTTSSPTSTIPLSYTQLSSIISLWISKPCIFSCNYFIEDSSTFWLDRILSGLFDLPLASHFTASTKYDFI